VVLLTGGVEMGGRNSYESIKRYEDKAYDKVLLRLPKGYKPELQSYAAKHGESLNAFIRRAIEEQIKRDTEQ